MSIASRVRRLAAMDREELRFRIRCEARKAYQRTRHAVRPPEWKRSQLSAILGIGASVAGARQAAHQGDFGGAHRALARHFAARASVWPVRAGAQDSLTNAIRTRFPDAASQAASRANAIVDGRYDLLGYRDVAWGTPPDWHHDPIHQAHAPKAFAAAIPYLDPALGDHKVIWELNRHQYWRVLGRAFWLTGDDRYRTAFISQLEDWLASNRPRSGINWASMLELGFRSLSWTWAVELFSRGAETDGTPWLVDLLIALDCQLEEIAHNLSRYFSPNTHLTGEALALYAVSAAFPELRRSADRQELGRRVLLHEASRQVCADGGHAERSAHYHRYSTDFYLLALLVARASRDTAVDRFEDIVSAHARYLRSIGDDRGRLPLLGDDDGGQLFGVCGGPPADASPTLAAAAAVLSDPALAVGSACEEVYWILGRPPAVSIDADARRAWPSRALSATGYFVSRTGRGDHLILDAGPHGYLNGGHSHSDALSMVLTVANQPLLVDPGTATYTMDPLMRDSFRSTRMHNTVVVDGADHVRPRGPFHWAGAPAGSFIAHDIEPAADFVQATHDAYGDAGHVRSVFALHGVGWLIVDHVFGDGERMAESYWHLHPMWSSAVRGQQIALSDAGIPGPAIAFTSPVEAMTDGPLALYAPEYGRIEPSCTLRAVERQRAPFAMAAFVSAVPVGQAAVTIRSLIVDEPLPRPWLGCAFSIRSPYRELLVCVAASPHGQTAGPNRPWGGAGVRTNARAVALLHANGDWHPLACVDGVLSSPAPAVATAIS
jgi:hypothetical protein